MNVKLSVTLADMPEQIEAAQRLRYDVFIKELGGSGPMVDDTAQLERDAFDAFADHLVLIDELRAPGDQVVGAYRIMTQDMAKTAGQFYCADEYDLTPLHDSGLKLMELGRSCLHADYRGGAGMLHLWGALADYVDAQGIDVLFGVASFHGTDLQSLARPLSLLHHRHLAPERLRVKARGDHAASMDMIAAPDLDRVAAVRQLPALIKGYLRLGATVGEGAFVDHAFNTTDICLILQRDAINGLRKTIYREGAARG